MKSFLAFLLAMFSSFSSSPTIAPRNLDGDADLRRLEENREPVFLENVVVVPADPEKNEEQNSEQETETL